MENKNNSTLNIIKHALFVVGGILIGYEIIILLLNIITQGQTGVLLNSTNTARNVGYFVGSIMPMIIGIVLILIAVYINKKQHKKSPPKQG